MDLIEWLMGIALGVGLVFVLLVLTSPSGYISDGKIGSFICEEYGYSEFVKINMEETTFFSDVKSVECLKDNTKIQIGEPKFLQEATKDV